MGFGKARAWIRQARSDRMQRIQASAETRSNILEAEAKEKRKLQETLLRQQKAQTQINQTNQLRADIRKEKVQRFVKPIKTGLFQVKKGLVEVKKYSKGTGKVWTGTGFEDRKPRKSKSRKSKSRRKKVYFYSE